MNKLDVYKIKKKEKIFIHAGFHKTGTTTIQYSLDTKRVFTDFHYLDLKNPIHSWPILCIVGARKKIPYNFIITNELGEHRFTTYSKEHTVQLLNNITRSPKDKHVISGEDIARFSIEELNTLKKLFQLLYQRTEVILYIRPPYSYINSAYQEMLKGGNIPPTITNAYLQYDSYIKNLDKVFGINNVNCYKFERNSLKGQDILLDFLSVIGANGSSVPNVSTNTSLSKESFCILYAAVKFSTKRVSFRNDDFLSFINALGDTKLKLHSDLIKDAVLKSEDGLSWVEERVGFSLSEDYDNDMTSIRSEDDILNYAIQSYPKLELLIDTPQARAIDLDNKEKIYNRIVEIVYESLKRF